MYNLPKMSSNYQSLELILHVHIILLNRRVARGGSRDISQPRWRSYERTGQLGRTEVESRI